MIGYQEIEALANRASELKEYIASEEGSKTSLVLPMLSALGYDIFNPKQIMAELTADVGIKRGEKVDYAIMASGKPKLIIECKKVGASLGPEAHSQLFRYFTSLRVRFGVLTDGIIYRFYTDIDAANIMDSRPFFEFNLLAYTHADLEFLWKFRKGCLVGENKLLLKDCSKRKLVATIRDMIRYTIAPDDQFVADIKSSISGTQLARTTKSDIASLVKATSLEECIKVVEQSRQVAVVLSDLKTVIASIIGKDLESSIKYRCTDSTIFLESRTGTTLAKVVSSGLELSFSVPHAGLTAKLRLLPDLVRFSDEVVQVLTKININT